MSAIPLEQARLCVECELLTELPACPRCCSQHLAFVSTWINRTHPSHRGEEAPRHEV